MPRTLHFLVAPTRAFAELAARPRFAVAYLLVVVTTGCAVALTVPNVDMFEAARSIGGSTSEHPTTSAELASTAASLRVFQLAYGFLGPALGYPLAALGAMILFRVASGRRVTYEQSLAIACRAGIPLVLRAAMTAAVAALRGGVSLQELDRGTVLASNLAVLLPDDAAPALWNALAHIDGFGLYAVVLASIGYAQALRIRRSRAIAILVVGGLFAVVLPSMALSVALG